MGLKTTWNLLWTWSKPHIQYSSLLTWQKVIRSCSKSAPLPCCSSHVFLKKCRWHVYPSDHSKLWWHELSNPGLACVPSVSGSSYCGLFMGSSQNHGWVWNALRAPRTLCRSRSNGVYVLYSHFHQSAGLHKTMSNSVPVGPTLVLSRE